MFKLVDRLVVPLKVSLLYYTACIVTSTLSCSYLSPHSRNKATRSLHVGDFFANFSAERKLAKSVKRHFKSDFLFSFLEPSFDLFFTESISKMLSRTTRETKQQLIGWLYLVSGWLLLSFSPFPAWHSVYVPCTVKAGFNIPRMSRQSGASLHAASFFCLSSDWKWGTEKA